MGGVGINHEEAANALKEEVEDYFQTLKEQEQTSEEFQAADRRALLDLFIEMARIDQENAEKTSHVKVLGVETPIVSSFAFTKWGQTLCVAEVELGGTNLRAEGASKEEAVTNLQTKVTDREPKFCCLNCGSRFVKEVPFQLHQESNLCNAGGP